MTIRHGILALSNVTPTLMIIDDVDPVQYSVSISVQNIDESATVYLGDSTVTTEDYGYILGAGGTFSLQDVPRYHGLHAVTDTNGSEVAIIRISK